LPRVSLKVVAVGPTLVGGGIGAVVGMGLHLLVESTTGFEAPWFALVIGLLTGLGVHQANKSLAGRVSYLRGAISAAIALAAIVGSPQVIATIAAKNDAAVGGKNNAAKPAAPAASGENRRDESAATTAGDDTEATAAPGELRGSPAVGAQVGITRPGDFNVWQFVFMAVGTFIAYEFGRGTGKGVATPNSPVEEPVAVEPSN
jgi:hypothetical protein